MGEVGRDQEGGRERFRERTPAVQNGKTSFAKSVTVRKRAVCARKGPAEEERPFRPALLLRRERSRKKLRNTSFDNYSHVLEGD